MHVKAMTMSSLINLPGDHDDHPGIPVRLGALFHVQPGLRANAPEEPLQHGPLLEASVASQGHPKVEETGETMEKNG